MATWSFMRVNALPMTLGIVFSSGMILCFCIAVLNGDVSPYIPFISETGGKYPEAGLFSMFLYFSSTIGLTATTVRYLIVDELNKSVDKSIDILNRTSFIIGFLALVGMVVVAAYPITTIELAHMIGANILFVGGCIYSGLQTGLSFRMTPYYNGKAICYIRMTITSLSALMLLIMSVLISMGQKAWGSASHAHWAGGKTPHDEGFNLLLVGAIAEWMMAILFVALYFTFIREFSKVWIHLRVQMLVQHFDDEPEATNAAVATQNTPIVM